MSGKAKRKHNAELVRLNKQLKHQINFMAEVLPKNYNDKDILTYFKDFYPFEWNIICEMYETYRRKDEFLVKQGKERRYKQLAPRKYFYSLAIVKKLTSDKYRINYNKNFNQDVRNKKLLELENKRLPKIKKEKTK